MDPLKGQQFLNRAMQALKQEAIAVIQILNANGRVADIKAAKTFKQLSEALTQQTQALKTDVNAKQLTPGENLRLSNLAERIEVLVKSDQDTQAPAAKPPATSVRGGAEPPAVLTRGKAQATLPQLEAQLAASGRNMGTTLRGLRNQLASDKAAITRDDPQAKSKSKALQSNFDETKKELGATHKSLLRKVTAAKAALSPEPPASSGMSAARKEAPTRSLTEKKEQYTKLYQSRYQEEEKLTTKFTTDLNALDTNDPDYDQNVEQLQTKLKDDIAKKRLQITRLARSIHKEEAALSPAPTTASAAPAKPPAPPQTRIQQLEAQIADLESRDFPGYEKWDELEKISARPLEGEKRPSKKEVDAAWAAVQTYQNEVQSLKNELIELKFPSLMKKAEDEIERIRALPKTPNNLETLVQAMEQRTRLTEQLENARAPLPTSTLGQSRSRRRSSAGGTSSRKASRASELARSRRTSSAGGEKSRHVRPQDIAAQVKKTRSSEKGKAYENLQALHKSFKTREAYIYDKTVGKKRKLEEIDTSTKEFAPQLELYGRLQNLEKEAISMTESSRTARGLQNLLTDLGAQMQTESRTTPPNIPKIEQLFTMNKKATQLLKKLTSSDPPAAAAGGWVEVEPFTEREIEESQILLPKSKFEKALEAELQAVNSTRGLPAKKKAVEEVITSMHAELSKINVTRAGAQPRIIALQKALVSLKGLPEEGYEVGSEEELEADFEQLGLNEDIPEDKKILTKLNYLEARVNNKEAQELVQRNFEEIENIPSKLTSHMEGIGQLNDLLHETEQALATMENFSINYTLAGSKSGTFKSTRNPEKRTQEILANRKKLVAARKKIHDAENKGVRKITEERNTKTAELTSKLLSNTTGVVLLDREASSLPDGPEKIQTAKQLDEVNTLLAKQKQDLGQLNRLAVDTNTYLGAFTASSKNLFDKSTSQQRARSSSLSSSFASTTTRKFNANKQKAAKVKKLTKEMRALDALITKSTTQIYKIKAKLERLKAAFTKLTDPTSKRAKKIAIESFRGIEEVKALKVAIEEAETKKIETEYSLSESKSVFPETQWQDAAVVMGGLYDTKKRNYYLWRQTLESQDGLASKMEGTGLSLDTALSNVPSTGEGSKDAEKVALNRIVEETTDQIGGSHTVLATLIDDTIAIANAAKLMPKTFSGLNKVQSEELARRSEAFIEKYKRLDVQQRALFQGPNTVDKVVKLQALRAEMESTVQEMQAILPPDFSPGMLQEYSAANRDVIELYETRLGNENGILLSYTSKDSNFFVSNLKSAQQTPFVAENIEAFPEYAQVQQQVEQRIAQHDRDWQSLSDEFTILSEDKGARVNLRKFNSQIENLKAKREALGQKKRELDNFVSDQEAKIQKVDQKVSKAIASKQKIATTKAKEAAQAQKLLETAALKGAAVGAPRGGLRVESRKLEAAEEVARGRVSKSTAKKVEGLVAKAELISKKFQASKKAGNFNYQKSTRTSRKSNRAKLNTKRHQALQELKGEIAHVNNSLEAALFQQKGAVYFSSIRKDVHGLLQEIDEADNNFQLQQDAADGQPRVKSTAMQELKAKEIVQLQSEVAGLRAQGGQVRDEIQTTESLFKTNDPYLMMKKSGLSEKMGPYVDNSIVAPIMDDFNLIGKMEATIRAPFHPADQDTVLQLHSRSKTTIAASKDKIEQHFKSPKVKLKKDQEIDQKKQIESSLLKALAAKEKKLTKLGGMVPEKTSAASSSATLKSRRVKSNAARKAEAAAYNQRRDQEAAVAEKEQQEATAQAQLEAKAAKTAAKTAEANVKTIEQMQVAHDARIEAQAAESLTRHQAQLAAIEAVPLSKAGAAAWDAFLAEPEEVLSELEAAAMVMAQDPQVAGESEAEAPASRSPASPSRSSPHSRQVSRSRRPPASAGGSKRGQNPRAAVDKMLAEIKKELAIKREKRQNAKAEKTQQRKIAATFQSLPQKIKTKFEKLVSKATWGYLNFLKKHNWLNE